MKITDNIFVEEIHEKRARCIFSDQEIKDILLRAAARRSGLDPYTNNKGTRVFLTSEHRDGKGCVYSAEVIIVNSIETQDGDGEGEKL